MSNKDVRTEFGKIINIGIQDRELWYRGHSTVISDNLKPSIFRNYDSAYENQFCNDFIKYGKGIETNFPKHIDEILFLMQHHGLPTRLLDWSENILVALYFSCVENKDNDGELIVLDYTQLYNYSKSENFENEVKFLFNQAFNKSNEEIKTELKISKIPDIPKLIYPHHTNNRLIAQQGVFTIHTYPAKPLEEIDKCITKIKICKQFKSDFLYYLHKLGINNLTLFPDLDGLANHLKNTKRFIFRDKPY